MTDVNANINVNIDTSDALSQLKALQRQISQFNTSIAKSSEAAALAQKSLQKNLLNSINSIGAFSAEIRNIKTTAESFTDSLEKNKLSTGEYFRYATASTKTFGKVFKSEFDTIGKVAEDRVKRLQTQYIKLGRDSTGAMKAIAVIPDQLDLNNHSTQLQLASQRQAIFNQLIKQGSTNLLNFGKNTQWAGRQLMVGFSIPLMTIGSAASKTFMQMETQALRFKKVYGDLFTSQGETQKALTDIQNLAKGFTQYGVAVSDTIGLAADAAAAGYKGVDLQNQTTAATRLSILGQIDNQKALQTTISLQSAFATSSQDLASTIDFLNAVENQTVTSLDDVTTAIPKAAPVVKQLGGDVKDLTFFLTAMKEGGINASEGANALKSGLSSMINPTNKASNFLAGFGINVKGIVEADKGNVKKMVIDMAKAFDTLDPLNRARAIEQMFGKFQFARISTLFQNVVKDGTQASKVLELTGASVQDLANLSDKELGITADSAMNKFKKSVEDLKIAIAPVGKAFLEAVTPIINFAGNVLDKFNGLSDGTKHFITLLTVGVAGVGPVLLMTFGLLANGIANIIKLFLTLRQGYQRLTGQSRDLGEQTQYLTTEQLDAAAVAHSLGQSHATLTQTFTAEAEAVNQLKIAYEQAISAGTRFAAMNPGMMMPAPSKGATKKLASGGVVSGPGTGTSDSIPAMLSNGESVIPAKQTKKYGSLVHGIIADNIPGFRKGRFGGEEPGSGSSGRIGKSGITIPIPYGKNVSSTGGAVDFLDVNPQDFVNVVSIYTKEIIKTAGTSVAAIDKEIDQWKMQNVNAIRKSTELVNQGVSAKTAYAPIIEKFNKDMAAAGGATSKFAETAKQMMPKLQSDLIQAQQKALELSLNVKKAEHSSRLLAELPDNIIAKGMATPGNFSSLKKPRQAAASIFGGSEGVLQYGIPRFMVSAQAPTSSPAYLLGSSQEHFSTTTKQSENLEQQRLLRQQAKQNVDAAIKETQIAAQVESPSKRTKKIGKDIARGLQVGMKEEEKATAQSGAKLADSAVVAAQKAHVAQTKRMLAVSGVPVDAIKAAQQRFNAMSPEEQDALVLSRMQGAKAGMIPERTPERLAMLQERAKNIKRARIKNNLRSVGSSFSGRLGSGVGLMGANMALGALPDFAGKNLIQDTMSGASMGMLFGPWGAAAGAAVGLVSSAIGGLIAKEKEQKAMAEAVFKSSADLATYFGNAVVNTDTSISNFSVSLGVVGSKAKEAGKSFGYSTEELKKFIDMVNSLPKDNPLKNIIDGLTNESNPDKIKSIAQSFITTQVALGQIKPEQAQKTFDLILGASNHIAMVGSAFMNVKTQTEAVSTTIKNAGNNTVALGTSLTQMAAAAANSTSLEQLRGILDGVASSGISAASALSSMYYAYLQVGNTNAANAVQILERVNNLTAEQSQLILAATAKGFRATVNATTQGSALAAEAEKFLKSPKSNTPATASAVSSANAQAQAQVATKKKEIELLKAKKKLLDDQIKQEQKITQEIKAQYDYSQKQQDLDQKIVDAKIKGNYLEAANLLQQKRQGTLDFTQEKKVSNLQSQADAIQAQIDAAQAASDQITSAINATTAAVTASGSSIVSALGALNFNDRGQTGESKNKSIPISASKENFQAYISANKITMGGVPMAPESLDPSKAWKNQGNKDRLEAYIRQRQSGSLASLTEGQSLSVSLVGSDGVTYRFRVPKDKGLIRVDTVNAPGAVKGKALGGLVKKYNTGGLIIGPGTGTSDSIIAGRGYADGGPIRVSNGEYVVRAAAVQNYGVSTMNAINNGTASVGSSGSTVYNIDMTINGGNNNAKEIADQVIQRLKIVSSSNNKSNKVGI